MLSRFVRLFGAQQDETEDLTTAQQNAASIDEIPADVPAGDPLPGDVRAALRERAAAGFDVYAYHAVGLPTAWYIWSGEEIDRHTGFHGVRFPVAQWRQWAGYFRPQDGGAA